MVNINEISVGDIVRIVGEFGAGCDNVPNMDRLLGTDATVTKVDYDNGRVWLAEDGGCYYWTEYTIESVRYGRWNGYDEFVEESGSFDAFLNVV